MIENLDDTEQAILRFVQDDIPLIHRPYAELSSRLGLSEEEICECLKKLLKRGVIRRFGAIIQHAKAGYGANAMVVWKIRDGMRDQAASILAMKESISHLYSRPSFPNWEYNLFSMVHAKTDEELNSLLNSLKEELEPYIEQVRIFKTVREFKKTSMKYFSEDD